MNESSRLLMTIISIALTDVIPELIASKLYWKGTLALLLLQNYFIIFCFYRDEVLRKNLKLLFTSKSYELCSRQPIAYFMVD